MSFVDVQIMCVRACERVFIDEWICWMYVQLHLCINFLHVHACPVYVGYDKQNNIIMSVGSNVQHNKRCLILNLGLRARECIFRCNRYAITSTDRVRKYQTEYPKVSFSIKSIKYIYYFRVIVANTNTFVCIIIIRLVFTTNVVVCCYIVDL